jgi:hypothetical protein
VTLAQRSRAVPRTVATSFAEVCAQDVEVIVAKRGTTREFYYPYVSPIITEETDRPNGHRLRSGQLDDYRLHAAIVSITCCLALTPTPMGKMIGSAMPDCR